MNRFNLSLVCLLVLAVWINISAAAAMESWGRHLDGNRGPYRGRVIDSETKKPLAGAVVVVYWRRDIPLIIQTNSVPYKAREVLTDKNGEFVINVEDVEKYAPPLTQRPGFVIFFPGYGAFPWFQSTPRGFTGGFFEGSGGVVELPRLKTRKERLEILDNIDSGILSDDPFKELPQLMRLINQERINLGFQPYGPRAPK
jgi:hypothetical protein